MAPSPLDYLSIFGVWFKMSLSVSCITEVNWKHQSLLPTACRRLS